MSTGARREVYVIVIWKNGQSRLRSKFSPEPTDLAGSQSLHSSPSSGMAPGRGGRNGGRGTPDETVVMDGKTLRRVFDDSTKRWVYRPVDESSGDVISREDFESRRLAEANLRKANDPRHKAAEEKRWLDEQRGAIREKRADAARQARREDFNTAVRDGRVERNRKGRGKIVDVPEPKALTELREEMRLAQIQDTQKKNPGRFAFIKTALDLEESKYANVVEKKRREAYERERKKKGVRGGGNDDDESSSDDSDFNQPVFRGSAADLVDPDYRRGPSGGGRGGAIAGGRGAPSGGRGETNIAGGRGGSHLPQNENNPSRASPIPIPVPRANNGREVKGGRGQKREGRDRSEASGGRGGHGKGSGQKSGHGRGAGNDTDGVANRKTIPAPKPAPTKGEAERSETGGRGGGRGQEKRGRGRGGGSGEASA